MSHEKGPTVTPQDVSKVRVTPEGSRVVNPLSIIGSESIRKHIDEVGRIVVVKKPSER